MIKLESLLKQVSEIVAKEKTQQEEKRKRGENFNIFNVLGLSTSEVRLHSAFLAELLNPNGDHGLGDKFLDAFLKIVIKREKTIFEFDTKSAKVFCEFYIGNISENYTEGGRIDIFIQDDNKQTIIIENKIYADDQKNQLLRYHNYAENIIGSNKYIILYLSLEEGDEPSKDSLGNKQFDYQTISYKKDIMNWLEYCVGIAALFPRVRETLFQYITNLKEITNIMSEDNKDEFINLLINEANIESTMSIRHYLDEIIMTIRKDFIDKRLFILAEKYGTELKYDKEFINLPSGEKKGYKKIRFINKEYHGYFQIENYGCEVYYGIVADGYREEEKKELEQFDDWCDGKSKHWPYGTKFFPGNLRYWDGKDTLIDMVKGHQLIDIIDRELTRIKENKLIEKLDKEIRMKK